MKYIGVLGSAFRVSMLAICCATVLPSKDLSLKDQVDRLDKRLKQLEDAMKSQNISVPKATVGAGESGEVEELHRQIGVLAAEVEKLRSGEQEIEVSAEKASSMGLSSSAILLTRRSCPGPL